MLKMRISTVVLRKKWYYETMAGNKQVRDGLRYIGLRLRFRDSYDMAVARGVIRYTRSKPDWELRGTGPWFLPLQVEGLERCEALIARIEGDDDAHELATLEIPVVDIAGACTRHFFNTVRNDDYATGACAGAYLRRLGCASYAWCGVEQVHWARERLIGFCGAVGVSPAGMPRFERSLKWWEQLYDASLELQTWLDRISRPTVLFCSNDMVAMKVDVEARRLGLDIPADLSILGVDDEELLCELATPSLSSVRLNCEQIGYEAAALLDRLLETPGYGDGTISVRRIAPGDVVERESTTLVLEQDPMVAQAVQMIRRDVHKGINVTDIVDALPVSRRCLEQRFKRARGRTLLDELQQERLRQACGLLRSTDLTMERICQECGFYSVQRFFIQFRRHYGTTPGLWRKAQKEFSSVNGPYA